MSKTTINQNQTGIRIRDGKIIETLSAGTYRSYKFRNESIVVYPAHSQTYVYSYNVRTVESAAVTVDITMSVAVVDAQKIFLSGKTAYEVVNQVLARQIQLAIESKALSELLEGNLSIDQSILADKVAEYGLQAEVELEPRVSLPRNLQNAIDAQEVARQRAKAELEEARGRSAVIRHYANVAKVTQDNPDLLRLLLGQKAKSINVAFDASERITK